MSNSSEPKLLVEEEIIEPIDSTGIYNAIELHHVLLADTIDLDSVNWFLELDTDLDYPVPYEYSTSSGIGREGGILNALFGSTSEHEIGLTSLQSVLYEYGENFEEALIILLEAGADPSAMGKDSVSCFDYVQEIRNSHIWEDEPDWQWKIDQMKRLTDTLFHFGASAKHMNLALVEWETYRLPYFVERGADPETFDLAARFMWGPEHRKRKKEWRQDIMTILELGGDPQHIDPDDVYDRWDPFDPFFLDAFLAHGLDLNKPCDKYGDGRNRNGYEYWLGFGIRKNYDRELLRYLLNHGAVTLTSPQQAYADAKKLGFPEDILELIKEKIGTEVG